MRALKLLAILGLLSACSSAPKTSVRNSEAYQYALKNAFVDLNHGLTARAPAAAGDLRSQFSDKFKTTERFDVQIFAKAVIPPAALTPRSTRAAGLSKMKYTQGKAVTYSFRKDKGGACALARELVPNDEMAGCVQFEVRPVRAQRKQGQYIRLFLNPDFRVFGMTYHEYQAQTDSFARELSRVKWDPEEPLSSDMLNLAREAVPLDLPIYASNAAPPEAETYRPTAGPRRQRTCQAYKFKYRNAYGANVVAHWCVGDPWPTEVETDGYRAFLARVY